MKYKLYYFSHFGLIFFVSFMSVINSYIDYHQFDKKKLFYINGLIKKVLYNPSYHIYTIFTGTNTGYGFYGINVATYKFFRVELYDKSNKIIETSTTFGFKNQNGLARFEVLASKMANYIVENKNYPKNQDQEILKVRQLYVNKIFKRIGGFIASQNKECTKYRVTLYTLMPTNIWVDKNYNESKKTGVYESIVFVF